jgi:hypothetical protein
VLGQVWYPNSVIHTPSFPFPLAAITWWIAGTPDANENRATTSGSDCWSDRPYALDAPAFGELPASAARSDR